MSKQIFQLSHANARRNAANAVMHAADGYMVVIDEPTKKRIQEEKYHAMIGDISRQVDLLGQRWDTEDAKRILLDAFARVMAANDTPIKQTARIVPSLEGSGVVQLGIQSRKFRVREAAEFIEYLYAFGAENNVIWTDKGASQ